MHKYEWTRLIAHITIQSSQAAHMRCRMFPTQIIGMAACVNDMQIRQDYKSRELI